MSITINQPVESSVNYDGEPRIITAVSTNGADHYYRLRVSDGATQVREQGWSRKNPTTADIALEYLFKNRYDFPFVHVTGNSIVHVPELIKTMNLTVLEYNLATDALVQQEAVNSHFVHKSNRPHAYTQAQLNSSPLHFLGSTPDKSKAPKTGVVRIPFMLQSFTAAAISITISDGTRELQTVTGNATAVGSYYFQLDLSTLTLTDVPELTIDITVDGNSISTSVSVVPYFKYIPRQLVFQNNYGHWVYAYLFGRLRDRPEYRREEYELQDDTLLTAEVTQEKTTTINTGYLTRTQLGIVAQMANALELYLFDNGRFQKATITNRRTNAQDGNDSLYNQDITLSIKQSQL